ncbi:peptidoglycan DD-metalloendopeptidase family protein [Methylobacillus gramineus]|uniref:murein hydrolase activator EnvC family protein n=1 Tax=Methylobacillus gramineus TaxID=755169 RepID=UPI001D0019D1|nr:peptidoglycan DD-metalloendopeptidase family protein [Methylobacillus gramineus]MCB5186285.1 peptidoglycan DD-metalloendopeptidase family protein [Methylobacillus gramineus]
MRNTWRSLLLAASLAAQQDAWAAKAEKPVEKPREALDEIHQRLESLKKELGTSTEAHAEAADELKKSEKAISEANRKLHDLDQQQRESNDALQSLQQKKSAHETELAQQQTLLNQQLYQQYLHGQPSQVQVFLQQQDPNTAARQLHYYRYVSRARSDLIASVQSNISKVDMLNAETSKTLERLDSLKDQQEKERQELQRQKGERDKLVKQLSSKISAQRNEIDKLKRDEQRLTQLMERLAKAAREQAAREKAAREKAERDAARQAAKEQQADKSTGTPLKITRKPSTSVGRNDTLPSNAFDGTNFASLKGKLNLPVRGEITNRFGSSREDTGISWKGLFIKASEGSEVKAVASGQVVFADWLRGFGNLMIIDHGNGYMSLYGNNHALLKRAGENVKGGDTVAAVGNSGGNEQHGVYFELRYQSKPFDPLSWSVIK